MPPSRREFFQQCAALGGLYLATASSASIAQVASPRPSDGRYRFPQGVASADPQPEAVVFWTRAGSRDAREADIPLRLQIARDMDFQETVIETELTASAEHDFTVRVLVDGLEPDRRYAYRFMAPDDTASRVGSTRTAPAPDAPRPLTVAVFSCQHYSDGFFSAYRQLLLDDQRAPAERKIDIVLHMGDFIYEFPEVDLYMSDGSLAEVFNRDGSRRLVAPLPSGGPRGSVRRAVTVDDFRHLYRTYLTDPDLQAARAAFPFVCVWDDHELINDYWQGFVLDDSIHQRKVNANQAWFEYIPAALTQAPMGPAGLSPARDFKPVEVGEALIGDLDDHYLVRDANNLAAIRSITTTRSLRWGQLVELLLPDERSYRGPRGVDSSLLEGSLAPYPLWPMTPETIEVLNAGRSANDGNPPDTIVYDGRTRENPRKQAPLGSMLGAEQKAWLKATLKASDAAWKVLCNSVPLLRFGLDVSFRPGEPDNGLLWTDSWDGYPVERTELMNFLLQENLSNVVSLAGDRHAHFAGFIHDDYDGADPKAVIPEFAGASTSSGCRAKVHGLEIQHAEELKPLFLSVKPDTTGQLRELPTLNAWLLFGADAARVLHETDDARLAEAAAKPQVNSHLHYADTDAYGHFVAHFGPERLEVEFVTIPEPLIDAGTAGPEVLRRVRYSVERWQAGEEPVLSEPTVEGQPPLLGIKTT